MMSCSWLKVRTVERELALREGRGRVLRALSYHATASYMSIVFPSDAAKGQPANIAANSAPSFPFNRFVVTQLTNPLEIFAWKQAACHGLHITKGLTFRCLATYRTSGVSWSSGRDCALL